MIGTISTHIRVTCTEEMSAYIPLEGGDSPGGVCGRPQHTNEIKNSVLLSSWIAESDKVKFVLSTNLKSGDTLGRTTGLVCAGTI